VLAEIETRAAHPTSGGDVVAPTTATPSQG